MIKKILSLLLLLSAFAIPHSCFSQASAAGSGKRVMDSLNVELQNAKQDTTRLRLLKEICFASLTEPNLRYGEQMVELADKILLQPLKTEERNKILIKKAEGHGVIANYYRQGTTLDFSKAIENAHKAINSDKEGLRIADEVLKNSKANDTVVTQLKNGFISTLAVDYYRINFDSVIYYSQQSVLFCIKNKTALPPQWEAQALYFLASDYWWIGNYPDAKEADLKALQKAELLHDTLLIGGCHEFLGTIERYTGNYRAALNYYSKAESLTKNIPDNDVLNEALIDKGLTYMELDLLDSAFTCAQEGMAMQFRKYHGKGISGGMQEVMGSIYSKMGNAKLAEDYFRQSFQLSEKMNDARMLARSYCEFAKHFERNNQLDSAIFYAAKASAIDRQYNFYVMQVKASGLLAKLYKQKNNIDSAYKYVELMLATKESVFSLEKISRMQTLEINEQYRQQEMETAKKAAEEERKQNIQYALIALGLIVSITLYLLLSRSVITNTKMIQFLGVMALLIVFEFLNLVLHPYLDKMTHHTPLLMLVALVLISALLIPLHHRIEKWATQRLVEKNKTIRLAQAKKTIEMLEGK